jgi:hypothetical protein
VQSAAIEWPNALQRFSLFAEVDDNYSGFADLRDQIQVYLAVKIEKMVSSLATQ